MNGYVRAYTGGPYPQVVEALFCNSGEWAVSDNCRTSVQGALKWKKCPLQQDGAKNAEGIS